MLIFGLMKETKLSQLEIKRRKSSKQAMKHESHNFLRNKNEENSEGSFATQ